MRFVIRPPNKMPPLPEGSGDEKSARGDLREQLRVNKLMIDCCDVMNVKEEKCRRYMIKYLTMISTVSTVLCIKSGTEEHLAQKDEMWQYMKDKDFNLFKAVKRSAMGRMMQLKSKAGQKAILAIYGLAQKIFVFN